MEGLSEIHAADRESIWIVEIVDEDGDLKIKQIEQFIDSSAHNNLALAVAAAKK